MPKKTFYLDKDKTESLIVNWGFNWKNLILTLGEQVVGQVPNVKELRKGKTFTLPDNQVLSIRLKRKWVYIQELEILLNNKPIPGSGTDPHMQLKQVYYLLLFIGAFNFGLGLIALVTDIPILKTLGLGIGSIIIGLI